MILIGLPGVLPRMPGQFIDSFQFICFFMLLQGQILCRLWQDKLMEKNESNVQEYPNRIKHNGDMFCWICLTWLRYFHHYTSLCAWKWFKTHCLEKSCKLSLRNFPRTKSCPHVSNHKSDRFNLAHHTSHHMTLTYFNNINQVQIQLREEVS